MHTFNPNTVSNKNNGLFGLPNTLQESDLAIISVPWDVTTSYRPGTSNGPQAISNASYQIELYHPSFPNAYVDGIALVELDKAVIKKNATTRKKAETLITLQETQSFSKEKHSNLLQEVNQACENMTNTVYNKAQTLIENQHLVAALGGDHSISYGLINALTDNISTPIGILQIDAHMDLRNAYEMFTYSHASIMFNVMKNLPIHRLVQVGVRDYCQEELDYAKASKGKIITFFDKDIKNALFTGKNWQNICKKIINQLPEQVYISLDIDGLTLEHCPNTGTPVPGGLSFEQIEYLIENLVKAGKKIVGFDLVEVNPGTQTKTDGIDAIVGMRLLYLLSGFMMTSLD